MPQPLAFRRLDLLRDHPAYHLLVWEWRSARRGASGGVLVTLAIGLFTLFQILSEQLSTWSWAGRFLHDTVVLFCFTPPFQDDRFVVAQSTPGYALLRWSSWVAIAGARLFLPALASRSVDADRQSGRLLDLQLSPFPAWQLFGARVLAYAGPYLLVFAWLSLPAVPVLLDEGAPPGEPLRICLETLSQILLTSAVVLALTAPRGRRWSGFLASVAALWLLIPFCWLWMLPKSDPFYQDMVRTGPDAFSIACLRHALLSTLILAWAMLSGGRTLDLLRSEVGLRDSLGPDRAG